MDPRPHPLSTHREDPVSNETAQHDHVDRTGRIAPRRQMRPRHYLMCQPTHFDVCYSINPWMDPAKPTSSLLALAQWEDLHNLFLALGHRVDVLEPAPGLPDMVFAANGATVVDGKALVARFRYDERTGEARFYLDWFREHGFDTVMQAGGFNEGEGDYLVTNRMVLAGTGFRTDRRSHVEAHEFFGRPIIALNLVDPRFYHLDTALAVLDDDEIMYYPPAFSRAARGCCASCSPTRSPPPTWTPRSSGSTRSPTVCTSCCPKRRPDSPPGCESTVSSRSESTCRNC